MRTVSDCHPNVPGSRQALIDAIEAFIARENLTRTGFGRDAVDDGSFLGRLDRGSDMRLDTADRVLTFLGKEPMAPRFLREIEAWLRVTRTKAHLLGRLALGDPTFVLRLERGRSPTLGTVDRVRAFMAANARTAEREAVRAAIQEGGPAVPADAAGEEETEMDGGIRYMKTREAAELLGLSPRTLETYRWRGGGPAFSRFGSSVRYLRSHLVAWAEARRVRSTSDNGPRREK